MTEDVTAILNNKGGKNKELLVCRVKRAIEDEKGGEEFF